MSKHHHQSKAEQIDNKAHGAAPFHYEKEPYRASESVKSEDIQTEVVVDNNAIQLRAYQIYQEIGGSDLDNWLEAEKMLSDTDKAVSRLINKGDPNTQKIKQGL